MMSGGYLDGSAGYTFSADIWSVGCVVIGEFFLLDFKILKIFCLY